MSEPRLMVCVIALVSVLLTGSLFALVHAMIAVSRVQEPRRIRRLLGFAIGWQFLLSLVAIGQIVVTVTRLLTD